MGASSLSDYLEQRLLHHSLGVATYLFPTAVYAAIFSASPTDAGGGTELATTTASQYARARAFFASSAQGAAQCDLATDIVFPTSGADWPTIVGVGIYDVPTQGGGNLLWWAGLTGPKGVLVNQVFKFVVGDLNATLS